MTHLSPLKNSIYAKTNHLAVLARLSFLRFVGLHQPLANFKYCTKLHRPSNQTQTGFTLLEMLLVIGLLGLIAMSSASLLEGTEDIKREQETQTRWDAIRVAILGQANASLNGEPYLSGYVADMGRLPMTVAELIDRHIKYDHDDDDTTPEIDLPFDHDNNLSTTALIINQPAWDGIPLYTADIDYNSNIYGGWRGPYLYAAGSSFYRDGWGNGQTDKVLDNIYFGWQVSLAGTYPSYTAFSIKSLGSLMNSSKDDFPQANSVEMAGLNDWSISVSQPITFHIKFSNPIASTTLPVVPPGSSNPHELVLRVYRYADNGDNTLNLNDIKSIEAEDNFTLSINDTAAPDQTIIANDNIPIGNFAALLWCTKNTSDKSDDVVYDGDCDGSDIEHNPVFFTLAKQVTQVSIVWNLP